MDGLGLKMLVINGDTIHTAQLKGEDIWEKATTEPNMLFMAPEQLLSKGFDALSKDGGDFASWVCVIAVDKAHLLNTWGASWRKTFRQIGWVQAQFSDVVMVAPTATMCGGKHITSVCQFLGPHQGWFHLL